MNSKFVGLWDVNNGNNFFQTCLNIANDENLFRIFKTNQIFCHFIGNDIRDRDQCEKFLNNISKELLKDIEKYKSNDLLGNPPLHYFDSIGHISSGTLYFLSILSRILKNFGSLNDKSICEIGSGYGGQAKIILDYGVKDYTCIDDYRTLKLAEKYLKSFNYSNLKFQSTEQVEFHNYDLVISNWCLSEFDDTGIDFYINNVIINSKNGYFEMNMSDPYRKNQLIMKLKTIFSEVIEISEVVKTGITPNFLLICKNNILIK